LTRRIDEMRSIKFQVFAKDWEGLEKCFEGYFLQLLDDGRYRVAFTNSDSDKEFVTVDREKLRLFTGLHDKNGKEIYEGDVLQHPAGVNAKVGYVTEHAAFLAHYVQDENAVYDYLDEDVLKRVEVIGNIYENPKLLEQTT
jgi:uncharacterized phage protein (TIGR01671 family)